MFGGLSKREQSPATYLSNPSCSRWSVIDIDRPASSAYPSSKTRSIAMPKGHHPQDDGTSSKLLSPDEARSPHTIDKLTDPSSFFLNIIEDVGRNSCCTKGTQTRLSVLSQSAQRLVMGSVNTLTPGQLAARKVFLWEGARRCALPGDHHDQ